MDPRDSNYLNSTGDALIQGAATVGVGLGQGFIAKSISKQQTAAQAQIAQQQLDLQGKIAKQQLDNQFILGKEANQAALIAQQTNAVLQAQTDAAARNDEAAAKKQFYILLAIGIGSAMVLGIVFFATKKTATTP